MKSLAALLLLTASFTPTVRACVESETALAQATPHAPAHANAKSAALPIKRVAAATPQKTQPAKPKPAPAPKPKPTPPPYMFM